MANRQFAAASALAAAFSLPAVPAAATALPNAARGPGAYDAAASTVYQARGWGVWGGDRVYYPDYGARYPEYNPRGVADPRASDDRYDDDPRWAAPDDRRGYSAPAPQRDLGLDRVADVCVAIVERARDRVDVVDGISRDTNGWAVTGALFDGSGFTCRIDTDGRLQDVHFGRVRAAVPLTSARERYDAPPEPQRPAAQAQDDQALAASSRPLEDNRYSAATAQPEGGQNLAVPAVATQPEGRQNLAAVPAVAAQPAAQDDSAYRVPKLPPPPPIPGDNGYAGARELPALPTTPESGGQAQLANSPAAAPSSVEGPARPADADEAAPPAEDGGPLPPADTSEALPVDPNQAPSAAAEPQPRTQPQDDGRYNASQAPDFGQTV